MLFRSLVVAYLQYPAIIAYALLSLAAIGFYAWRPAPLAPTLLTIIGLERSSLADGAIHRYLMLGVGILPAAAAYACFGLIQLVAMQRDGGRNAESGDAAEAMFNPIPMPKQEDGLEKSESVPADAPQRLAA